MTGEDGSRLGEELVRARSDLQDLRSEFADLADPDVVGVDDEHDSEGSTIGFERARVAGLISRAERRIADLEAAAERARTGSYHRCQSCGGQIGAERLEALPAARTCVSCAARAGMTAGGFGADRRIP